MGFRKRLERILKDMDVTNSAEFKDKFDWVDLVDNANYDEVREVVDGIIPARLMRQAPPLLGESEVRKSPLLQARRFGGRGPACTPLTG